MIAIIEIGGKQYTVTEKTTFTVDHQEAAVGAKMEFTPLLVADESGKTVKVGTPLVEGGKVVCHVDSHDKGDKVRVFKIKSKKRYVRNRGFRPLETTLTVESIA